MKAKRIEYSTVNLNTLPKIIVALEGLLEISLDGQTDQSVAEETKRRIEWALKALESAGVKVK